MDCEKSVAQLHVKEAERVRLLLFDWELAHGDVPRKINAAINQPPENDRKQHITRGLSSSL